MAPASTVVEDFVASLGEPAALSREIDSRDEMFRWNVAGVRGSEAAGAILYFEKGRQIADAFEAALRWRFGAGGPRTLLDFASGFGRATRFLVGRLPGCRIAVAEIDPEAVRFQERTFGVRGFVSAPTAEEFSPAARFDAITAASFFSHLPARAFEEWLARLYGLLEPGGALVFSTHGRSLRTEPADWTEGIVFDSKSETSRLDGDAYGTSWVTPEFVAGAAARACEGEGSLAAAPFGLCGHQDLYVLARPPSIPAKPLVVPEVPRGELESSALPGGRALAVSGWAEASLAPSVELLVGRTVRERSPAREHGSRRRWSFEIPIAGVDPDEVIRVAAVSAAGVSRTVAIGTLRPYLETEN
ncbi:MAG: class I SAM-dependent methyltransferase [Acidobacteriota bacterium]|nr:class I SAM-dependent methyltransferase [Acidobacteriota bacterium]